MFAGEPNLIYLNKDINNLFLTVYKEPRFIANMFSLNLNRLEYSFFHMLYKKDNIPLTIQTRTRTSQQKHPVLITFNITESLSRQDIFLNETKF